MCRRMVMDEVRRLSEKIGNMVDASLGRLRGGCILAAAYLIAGTAYAAPDATITPAELERFMQQPETYFASLKESALEEAAYALAVADIANVPIIAGIADKMPDADKLRVAKGLGRAAKAYIDAGEIEKAVKLQHALRRQGDVVRAAFNAGAGQRLLAEVNVAVTSSGNGAVQTDSVLPSGQNGASAYAHAPAGNLAGVSSSAASAAGVRSAAPGCSIDASGGSANALVCVIKLETNIGCTGICTGPISR